MVASQQGDILFSSPLAVRRVNDQLMLVERSFIDPQGLPGRSDYKYVLHLHSVT